MEKLNKEKMNEIGEKANKAIDGIMEEVKKRSQNVTAKTLKAWIEHNKRIAAQKLLTKEEANTLIEIESSVRQKWLDSNL